MIFYILEGSLKVRFRPGYILSINMLTLLLVVAILVEFKVCKEGKRNKKEKYLVDRPVLHGTNGSQKVHITYNLIRI